MADDVRIVVRASNQTQPGLTAVNQSVQGLVRDINGRLRDARGRFVAETNGMTAAANQAAGAIGQGGAGGPGMGAAMGVAGVAALSALPALGALVPMVVGLGAAAGVAKLAFSGVGEAVALAGEDQEAYAKALKKMGPEQREFTKTLVAAKKEFGGFGKEIQKIALPGFTAGLKAARPVMDTFKGGMKEMAGVMGDLAKDAGEFIASPKFRNALKKNFELGAQFVDRFARGLGRFGVSLLDFGAKSKRTLDALGGGISDLLGRGLPGMFKGLEQGIGGSAKMFDGLFDALNMILPALGRFSGSLANAFGPALGAVFRHIGRVVSAILDGLRPAMDQLAPVMSSAADSLDEAGGAVEPLAKLFGNVLGVAVQGATVVFKNMFDLFRIAAPYVKELGSALTNSLLPSFKGMDGSLGWIDKFRNFVENNKLGIMSMFQQGADAFMGFVIAIVDGMPAAFGMFRLFSVVALEAFETIVQGAAWAFSWMPGIGDQLDEAAAGFGRFKDGVNASLDLAGEKINGFRAETLPKLESNRLKMNISNWEAQIAEAKRQLSDENLPPSKRGRLLQNIADWEEKIRRAKRQAHDAANGNYTAKFRGNKRPFDIVSSSVRRWRAPDKTSTIRGNAGPLQATINRWQGRTVGSVVMNIVGNMKAGGRAHGGIIGAAAAGGPRGNLTWVGERGPELVRLPVGSTVRTAGDSQRLMRQAGGGAREPMVLELRSSGSDVDELLLRILRRAIRVQGGNAQIVLGTGA